ncbi:hypothetical protein [Streptomyces sp. NPDC006193]|uniref:hypothetical protein n=1 Tax=Streptomyces sp. NPDC006193 TaxID=3155717 RepID=UPI0033BA0294
MAVQEPGSEAGPEERPVPRDLPDQQAGPGEDPWEVVPGRTLGDEAGEESVPDTDEAGSGPRGTQGPGTSPAEQPGPDEPTA